MSRDDVLEEAAKVAEFYGEERLRLGGDTILHDPILAGAPHTAANLQRSQEAMIDGCINSASYHAARHIAELLRALKSKP